MGEIDGVGNEGDPFIDVDEDVDGDENENGNEELKERVATFKGRLDIGAYAYDLTSMGVEGVGRVESEMGVEGYGGVFEGNGRGERKEGSREGMRDGMGDGGNGLGNERERGVEGKSVRKSPRKSVRKSLRKSPRKAMGSSGSRVKGEDGDGDGDGEEVIGKSTSDLETATPSTSHSQKPGRKRKTPNTTTQNGNTTDSPTPRKKPTTKKPPTKYTPPSTYSHLPPIPDILSPSMYILFIGLNPGVMTATRGHMYSHPTNLFWRLLFQSGITPHLLKPCEDQILLTEYGCGNTNIVERPTRNGAELSKMEMDGNVKVLEGKVGRWKPEVVCVVGKSVWESVFRVKHRRTIKKGEFSYGWQEERMGVLNPGGEGGDGGSSLETENTPPLKTLEKGDVNEPLEFSGSVDKSSRSDGKGDGGDGEKWMGARVFVATSTSGLAATVPYAEKLANWKELGDWINERRAAKGVSVRRLKIEAGSENAEVVKEKSQIGDGGGDGVQVNKVKDEVEDEDDVEVGAADVRL